MYEIVEMYPVANYEMGIHSISVHDNLDDANVVMAALESVNYNWTAYGMIMRPVWEERHPKPIQLDMVGWDANGSPTF